VQTILGIGGRRSFSRKYWNNQYGEHTMGSDKMEIGLLVEGGKASGGPPLGPAVGPTGIPIKDVVDKINDMTQGFKGLKVPVTVLIDTEEKTFEIKISTPSASALLFKEGGLEGGSGKAKETKAGDLSFEQILTVAKMKRSSLTALTMKGVVKTILGTALSAGITIDGKEAKQVTKEVAEGQYDDQLKGAEE
jgi:large subunit ribosomal protein L11